MLYWKGEWVSCVDIRRGQSGGVVFLLQYILHCLCLESCPAFVHFSHYAEDTRFRSSLYPKTLCSSSAPAIDLTLLPKGGPQWELFILSTTVGALTFSLLSSWAVPPSLYCMLLLNTGSLCTRQLFHLRGLPCPIT